MSKPSEQTLDLGRIYEMQRQFTKERDWDQFHTPKNLAMALSVEASELSEIFQWLDEKQSKAVGSDPKTLKKVKDELADVLFYLCRMSDGLGIDLEAAFWEKMEQNAAKYPVDKSKGRTTKYDEL